MSIIWHVRPVDKYINTTLPSINDKKQRYWPRSYRSLLASRSDSSSVRMSPSRTGPLTLRMIWRFCSPMNSTLTCVHWPWEPVRPRTMMTRAKTYCLSILRVRSVYGHQRHVPRTPPKRKALTVAISYCCIFETVRHPRVCTVIKSKITIARTTLAHTDVNV